MNADQFAKLLLRQTALLSQVCQSFPEESKQFNSRLQPIQIGLGAGSASQNLLKLNFDYGTIANNGNVLSQTITVPTIGATAGFTAVQTYTYDNLNRIKDAKEMNGTAQEWKQTFLYDRYGNRRFDTANNNTTTLQPNCQTAVCNPTIDPDTNKLVGYTFDNAGNTSVDAENRQFIYDAENKQVEVKDANNISIGKYFYDGDGKRVKKISNTETTIFVYNANGQLVAEYSTQISTTPQISYLTNDHLGSPRTTTDQNGTVVSRRDFQPFGEEIARASYGTDNVRQKFTSYERDNESDLDFAQARYYSSKLGRFYSVDPENAGASEDDPQSWNGYAYSRNNPVLFTDPDGLDYKVCYINGGGCFNYTNEAFATYLKDIGGAGFVAKGEAKNGGIYDVETGDSIATFTYFTTADQDAVAALTGGAEPLLSVALPIIELIQPTPLPAGGMVIGGIVKGSKIVRVLRKAKWAGVHKYGHGTMKAIDHVIQRHGPSTTFTNVGKFRTGAKRKIMRLADEAVSNLNGSQTPSGNGFIYDFGKVIGTHRDGTLTTKVQVYLNSAGEILSMFPVN